MIKITSPLIENEIVVEGATTLSIKNPTMFANLIENIYQYDEDSSLKIFRPSGNRLTNKEVVVASDILNFDLNSTPLRNAIQRDIIDQLNYKLEVKMQIEDVLEEIENIMTHVLIDHELNIEFESLDLPRLLKAMKIGVKSHNFKIFNRLFDIIDVCKYLKQVKVLVFVNTFAYLTSVQRQSVFEYINMNYLDVLFIEPVDHPASTKYYLDEDFYLFIR